MIVLLTRLVIQLFPIILLLTACGKASEKDGKAGPSAVSTVETAGPVDNEKETPIPPKPLPTPKTYFGDLGRPHVTEPIEFASKQKNSVVLIVIDALNVRHLTPYGYERDTSPNIKALADRGLMLTNHVSNSSWTRPSITTIMTGLTKQQHGVELNGQHLKEEVTTTAERFRSEGFRTAGFVGNPLVRKIWGFGQGFQTYEDTSDFEKAFPPDNRLASRAIEWLEKVGDAPFFLMVFFTAPHVPYRPPSGYRKFLQSVPDGPVIAYPFKEYMAPLPKGDHDRIEAAYDGEIEFVDSQVGRLAAYLQSSGKRDRTAVVVTADHGEVFGQHNCYTHTWHMWEQALRVPFVLSAPGLEKVAGMIDDRPFTHADIAPTLFHLAGLTHDDPKHQGKSIVERLAHPTMGRTRTLFSQYNAHGVRRQAIRKGPLKLIHHHVVPRSALKHLDSLHPNVPSAPPDKLPSLALDTERYELYDLVADPDEEKDLFASMRGSADLDELMGTLSSVLTRPAKPPPTLSEETLEALRNAGYIQ